jgi:TrmH RNA methyltransferase
MRDDTSRFYGVNACFALANARFEDVERAFVTEEGLRLAKGLLGALADAQKPYRVVPPEELEKISGTNHHEGICLFAKPRREPTLAEVLARKGPRLLAGLPGVRNPHNLGAILRVAAHFSVDALLIDREAPRIAGAVARSAEGGAEHVDVVRIESFEQALELISKAGVKTLATSSHATRSIYDLPYTPRLLVLFGAEDEGLDGALTKRATTTVSIPGSGAVESLNVATAAAVCLASLRARR